MLLNVWSAMVGPSLSAWLMIVSCRFESGRHRSLRNAPHPLSDVQCGLAYAVGRKAFLLSLPGRFVDYFTDGGLTVLKTLQCALLRTPLPRAPPLPPSSTLHP